VRNHSTDIKQDEKTKRKLIIGILAVGVSILVAGGSAIAYYSLSATGSGSTHATLVTPSPDHQTVTVRVTCSGLGTLEPGTHVTCTYALDNKGTFGVKITQVALYLSSDSTVACPISWFGYTTYLTPHPSYLAPGTTYPGSFQVSFYNQGFTQDSCWGHTITVHLEVNPS
jgi:hypothetical protein